MKKFKAYRIPEQYDYDQHIKEHELIGVVEGNSFEEAMGELTNVLKADLQDLTSEFYFTGDVDIYDIEILSNDDAYQFVVEAAFIPDSEFAPGNTICNYGIKVEEI